MALVRKPKGSRVYDLLCLDKEDTSQIPDPNISGELFKTSDMSYGRMVTRYCATCSHVMSCEFGVRISLPILKPPIPEP